MSLLAGLALAGESRAQVAAPIQATARPFNLAIDDKVNLAGSDAASALFQKGALPYLTNLVNTRLSETKSVNDSFMLLDPSKLRLSTLSDVRVYFIGEGAGYHNTLGFNTAGGGIKSGSPELIFPDASSRVSTYWTGAGGLSRTAYEPLLPGDFVQLGAFPAGTQLDFFLISDGANGGRNVYSTQRSVNPDGINHVVSFAAATPTSSYLVLAFEDLFGGGDRDFNDVIFALDIGKVNLQALTAAPEPSLLMVGISMVAVACWMKRRRPTGITKPA